MAKLPPLSDEDRANLVAYLDGELEPDAARGLEAKLHLDAAMRAEAEALRRTWEILDYLPRPEPSAGFASRTLERISGTHAVAVPAQVASRTGWSWYYGLGWAAAALLAGTVGFAGVSALSSRHRPPAPPAEAIDYDQLLVRDLRVIENKPLYEFVDDINFLNRLDDPDLFGDES